MPTWLMGCRDETGARRREAERQVREKFPNLMKGSSGWHRAVENRYRRMRA